MSRAGEQGVPDLIGEKGLDLLKEELAQVKLRVIDSHNRAIGNGTAQTGQPSCDFVDSESHHQHRHGQKRISTAMPPDTIQWSRGHTNLHTMEEAAKAS